MKYVPLGLLTLLTLSCTHTQYTEASVAPTFLFHYSDKVTTALNCSDAKRFNAICGLTGIVRSYIDTKTMCYPGVTYLVEFPIGEYGSSIHSMCADELVKVAK